METNVGTPSTSEKGKEDHKAAAATEPTADKDVTKTKNCTQKKGKQPKWKDLDSLGAVQAVVVLPD